jgi:transcriptional regulator with PAS, ATPase and Fis domain
MPTKRKVAVDWISSFIEDLPEPRVVTDIHYQVLAANRAYREHYGLGTDAIGRRCYEISHGYAAPCDEAGETCPRRRALASGRTERILHVHHTPRGDEHVQVELSPVRDPDGRIALFVERMESLPTSRDSLSTDALVGKAPAFLAMLRLAGRVAPTDTSVLLLGETGTGKELVARLIHDASPRAQHPFVPVDCSGLTETLFESELFGHEKGAFTGASTRTSGLVDAAAGGTLFLDEVGDIPLALQVKLLRLLETGVYRRVGGVEPIRSSFRLVAATHRDLDAMVRDGSFRHDLYYRISTYPIRLPALRQRREDIAQLAETLLARVRPGRALKMDDESLRALIAHDFPGNIRELRNVLERASLLAEGDTIGSRHLPLALVEGLGAPVDAQSEQSPGPHRLPLPHPEDETPLRAAEHHVLEEALAKHCGSRRELAEALGISERTLYRKLVAFGLSKRR